MNPLYPLLYPSLHRDRIRLGITLAVFAAALPMGAHAANTGTSFQTAYQFIYDAATGYLGRGIAITGGVIGLGIGAASGKALPAVIGIVLGIFGALGPTIINTIFNTAIV
jgi:TrbC/VIRB2 family.